MFRLALLLIIFIFNSSFMVAPKSDIDVIQYSYAGNHKAKILIPDKKGKLPVIIYNYHQDYDKAGELQRYRDQHNIDKFMKEFQQWGCIVIVPIERHLNIKSIEGAIKFARKHPRAQQNNIHLIGNSHGGFLSILASTGFNKPSSLIVINPEHIHQTGHLSLPNFMRQVKKLDIPILQIVGEEIRARSYQSTMTIKQVLIQEDKGFVFVQYPKEEEWFWNPEHEFINDIYEFIFSAPYPFDRPGFTRYRYKG